MFLFSKKTFTSMNRCLVADHCATLPGTDCRPDEELSGKPGFESYFTCQCKDGYQVNLEFHLYYEIPDSALKKDFLMHRMLKF